MARESSQKFVGRNRPPRVQLEYDVELYGAEKKVQVPFVMGVMSDLSGVSGADLPPVADRKPVEIQSDNFDARLKSMKPRVQYSVENKLTGEGEARTELANLVTYMDGKTGAEDLIAKILNDPALLKSLASKPDAKST